MSGTLGTDCRRLGPDDVDEAVATLVVSRIDAVWEGWLLPGSARTGLAEVLRASIDLIAVPHGQVWATPGVEAVAVWVPTDLGPLLDEDTGSALAEVTGRVLGARAAMAADVDAVVATAAVPPSQWYLASVGTRPPDQGRGLGTAVLRPMIDHLDRSGAAAHLETSSERNLPFYRRLGFEVVAEFFGLPHGAPPVWVMHRPPG